MATQAIGRMAVDNFVMSNTDIGLGAVFDEDVNRLFQKYGVDGFMRISDGWTKPNNTDGQYRWLRISLDAIMPPVLELLRQDCDYFIHVILQRLEPCRREALKSRIDERLEVLSSQPLSDCWDRAMSMRDKALRRSTSLRVLNR